MNSKVVKNAGWIIGCKLIKAVLTLLVTALTTRYLGVANYGLINYAAGIVAFVSPIMKLGMDSIIVFELVSHPEKEGETLGTVILLSFFSGVLCILGVIAFTAIANAGERETMIVCGLYSLLLIFQALEMIQYWFHAKLMARYSSLAMLAAYIVVALVQTVLILSKARIYWFALSHSIDYAVITVILLFIYRRQGGQPFSFSLRRAEKLFSVSRYYIVSSLMVTVFNNTDRVMLKLMAGNEEAGLYSAAHTCASMTSFIFMAIVDSMRPMIFAHKSSDPEQFRRGLTGLYSIILYFSFLQCVVMSLFSGLIIRVMCGSAYQGADTVLSFTVWFTTFSYLGVVRNIWILSEGKQKYLWRINLAGASMNVVLNYLLIPSYGAIGAAVASVISQFFTNVVVGYIIPAIRPNNRLMLDALHPAFLLDSSRDVLRAIRNKLK